MKPKTNKRRRRPSSLKELTIMKRNDDSIICDASSHSNSKGIVSKRQKVITRNIQRPSDEITTYDRQNIVNSKTSSISVPTQQTTCNELTNYNETNILETNSNPSNEHPILQEVEQLNADQEELVKSVSEGLRVVVSWECLAAYLVVNGKSRFTKANFEVWRDTVSTASGDTKSIPAYRTIRTTQNNYFTSNCYPNTLIKQVPMLDKTLPIAKKIKMIEVAENLKTDVRHAIKLVLPSEWAKYDLSLYHVYREIIEGEHHHQSDSISIENANIVRDRPKYLGSSLTFWTINNDTLVPAQTGATVQFKCAQDSNANLSYSSWPTSFCHDKESTVLEIQGKVGFQWCVTKPSYNSPRNKAFDTSTLNKNQANIFNWLRSSVSSISTAHQLMIHVQKVLRSQVRHKRSSKSSGVGHKSKQSTLQTSSCTIYPGDICTFINKVSDIRNESHVECVHVSSTIAAVTGRPSDRLIWFDMTDEHNRKQYARGMKLNYTVTINVQTSPELMHQSASGNVESNYQQPAGFLEDGRRYVVYRFGLYADEFKEKRAKRNVRNVCAIYISILGCNIRTKNTSGGVRVLTIVPYGHDSNYTLRLVMDDIVNGVCTGIPGVDAYGREIVIFLDNVTVFGDYLKVNAITDSMGHNALAFCNYCFIRKDNNSGGPWFCFSSDINGRRLSFQRSDEKLDVLRNIGLSTNERILLGLTSKSNDDAESIPTVYFSNMLLQNKHKIPRTTDGFPVVNHLFESSISVSVAPDHLITGLISNLLEMCLYSFPSIDDIWNFQSYVLSVSAENNLPTEGPFIKIKDNTFSGISTLSMSTLYVLLLCSITYFDSPISAVRGNDNPFKLCRILQDFVSLLYYWPTPELDLEHNVRSVRGNNGLNYLGVLHQKCKEFVTTTSLFVKNNGKKCRLLDKPNIHRLLELTATTLPLFGHGRIVSELVLEMVHFFFKKWFEDNAHPDSHITAVDLALSRYWSYNFYVAYKTWKFGNDNERPLASKTLLRLFFGSKIFNNNLISKKLEGLYEDFFNSLDGILKKPVMSLLDETVPSTYLDCIQEYRCEKLIKNTECDDPRLCWGLEIIAEYLKVPVTKVKEDVRYFQSCSLITIDKYKKGSHSYPYKTISFGTAVNILVSSNEKEENIIISKNTKDISDRMNIVVAVRNILDLDNHIWLVGVRFIQQGTYFVVSNEDVIVVRLTTTVQRVGLVHICSTQCKLQKGTQIIHTPSIFQGGRFRILFRNNGFPPFLG